LGLAVMLPMVGSLLLHGFFQTEEISDGGRVCRRDLTNGGSARRSASVYFVPRNGGSLPRFGRALRPYAPWGAAVNSRCALLHGCGLRVRDSQCVCESVLPGCWLRCLAAMMCMQACGHAGGCIFHYVHAYLHADFETTNDPYILHNSAHSCLPKHICIQLNSHVCASMLHACILTDRFTHTNMHTHTRILTYNYAYPQSIRPNNHGCRPGETEPAGRAASVAGGSNLRSEHWHARGSRCYCLHVFVAARSCGFAQNSHNTRVHKRVHTSGADVRKKMQALVAATMTTLKARKAYAARSRFPFAKCGCGSTRAVLMKTTSLHSRSLCRCDGKNSSSLPRRRTHARTQPQID